ncbi:MAG: bifunctional (p)ppGpp synthetase/guanosine-3',5'-bis(diphosphate) 3'-pyrophosphohydrolase [Gemmatimonadales bacterium]|nr:MAG: bifunctional (p)ppGpp synthetase/guanosine-3',5'-bis(diphosphate) 3'-pyrophosphohydrolase [Gemmatimonadales bacterium]
MKDEPIELAILKAARFAADRHRMQRRKDADASPYINHPIAVAETLASAGVVDRTTLLAAILHDVIEDTETEPDEITELFGDEVRAVVEEVSADRP